MSRVRKLTLDPYSNVSNLSLVREELKVYCLEHLHDVALSIESLLLDPITVVLEVPNDLSIFSETADPHKLRLFGHQQKYKEYLHAVEERKLQLRKLYGIIYSTFTHEIKLRVESHIDYADIQTS
jgi:hypothetical protein